MTSCQVWPRAFPGVALAPLLYAFKGRELIRLGGLPL